MNEPDDAENENNSQNKEITLKLLIIGDSRVGKTSLLLKYVDHVFPEEHIATIGVEYKDKRITREDFDIRLQIWDTAGQERFHSITKNIYRNANGVIFVCDITNRNSFNNIRNWIKDTENIDQEIRGIILGNKVDLKGERAIETEDLKELAEKNKMPFLECSAKENINVNEAFDLIIDELLKGKNLDEIMELYSRKTRSDLSISTKKTKNAKSGGCC